MDPRTLTTSWAEARAAHEAFTGAIVLITGMPVTPWDDLPEPIKEAWMASAHAARTYAPEPTLPGLGEPA